MGRAFEAAKSRDYPTSGDPAETAALRFVQSWHAWPPLRVALHYHGVNLGETDEYPLFPEVLGILLSPENPQAR